MKFKLKRIREEKGYSQDELAKLSNVSRTVISNIETKPDYITTTGTLKKLAKVLDISLEDFF